MISLDKPHLIFRNQQDLAIHFITPLLSLHRKSTSISRKIQNPKFPEYISLQKNNKLGKATKGILSTNQKHIMVHSNNKGGKQKV